MSEKIQRAQTLSVLQNTCQKHCEHDNKTLRALQYLSVFLKTEQ